MKKTVLVLIAAALLLFTGACDETRTGDGQGRLVINVTDGPFDISDIENQQLLQSQKLKSGKWAMA